MKKMGNWNSSANALTLHQSKIREWLQEIHVPNKKLPDYSQCQCFRQTQEEGSELFALWNPDRSKLYIVEFFM